jgi:hypothetical protein
MYDLEGLDAAEWARRVLADMGSGREAVRAFFYSVERGVPRNGRFDEPTCGKWECLRPEHQSWVDSSEPDGIVSELGIEDIRGTGRA